MKASQLCKWSGWLVAVCFGAAAQSGVGQSRNLKPTGGWGWSSYHTVTGAPLVALGTCKPYRGEQRQLAGHPLETKCRVFRVQVDRVLKGSAPDKEIFVMTRPLSTPFVAPLLFSRPYILFLQPIQDGLEREGPRGQRFVGLPPRETKEVMQLLQMPEEKTYSVYGHWAGAISLDPEWPDVANDEIHGAYRVTQPKHILAAIEAFCQTIGIRDLEKKKETLENLKRRGGLYEAFAEEALKEMVHSEPKKDR